MFTQIFLSEIISTAENGGQGTHFLISQILKGLTHSALERNLLGPRPGYQVQGGGLPTLKVVQGLPEVNMGKPTDGSKGDAKKMLSL